MDERGKLLIPLLVMLIDFFLDFHERIYNAN